MTHAFVEVNGRALGLYVVIEAMNKEFLKQYFRIAKGNLYEAYLQDIDQKLDQDGGSDTSQADLKRLLDVCKLEDRRERAKPNSRPAGCLQSPSDWPGIRLPDTCHRVTSPSTLDYSTPDPMPPHRINMAIVCLHISAAAYLALAKAEGLDAAGR